MEKETFLKLAEAEFAQAEINRWGTCDFDTTLFKVVEIYFSVHITSMHIKKWCYGRFRT